MISVDDNFFGFGHLFGTYRTIDITWTTPMDTDARLHSSETTEILFDPLFDAFMGLSTKPPTWETLEYLKNVVID